MALLAYFAVFVLAAAHGAVGQKGFLSIDCGLEDNSGGYKDPTTGVVYVSDGPYVDAGEPHKVAADQGSGLPRAYQTLRSFPSGERNCYTLPTVAGAKYLVRVVSFYGNYDGMDGSSTLQFDLYIGVDRWTTVHADRSWLNEALFVAWASWTPVCLVKTGPASTPFVSSVELRTLASDLYPELTANDSMCFFARYNMGSNISVIRYPNDTYDRYWWQLMLTDSTWKNLSTVSPIQQTSDFALPLPVMQTAIETGNNNTELNLILQDKSSPKFMVYLHFADFQNSQLRQFDVSSNDQPSRFSPIYLVAQTVNNADWYKAPNGVCNITLTPTAASKLPPMLNAFEIYTLISQDNPRTFPRDFDIIMAIKFEYGLKKNWNGDPCFPTELAWDGVKCSITSGNTRKITSVDLSNSNLHGAVSNNFTLLTALEYLNLSGNQLDGRIPAGPVCKNNGGSFVFSYDGYVCNTTEDSNSRNLAVILVPSIVVPVIAITILGLAYYILRRRRKPRNSTDHPSIEHEHENPLASRQSHDVDALPKVENRQFTYKELEKFTNKFERFIGQGGFGSMYYGRLEDGMQVAVKMRSESSSHGLDEFLAEVQSLTKVHHKNLVSLVGYCWQKDHLALVYEYMARGSLYDLLRGQASARTEKVPLVENSNVQYDSNITIALPIYEEAGNPGVGETLNWRTRVQVVLEAAQGLDYLHNGCSPPIIHRDVKTRNILLSQNLQAKITDFGLSKTYHSDTQTHISVTPAGSAGYMDPEYCHTSRLTESSDVYSFGVVLLEVVTGESPILPGLGHIIQRVKKKIDSGNISFVSDARLRGAYDISSMWKVVDVRLSCTADVGNERPTMASVVMQLKESLVLEEAHANSGFHVSTGALSDTKILSSTIGASAR